MEIVIFVFGTIGMTHIIVDSDMPLIAWFRDSVDKYIPNNWAKLVRCYTCMGFWAAILCAWLVFSQINMFQLFVAGCAGSFLSNFMALVMNYLEAAAVVTLHDNDINTKG